MEIKHFLLPCCNTNGDDGCLAQPLLVWWLVPTAIAVLLVALNVITIRDFVVFTVIAGGWSFIWVMFIAPYIKWCWK